MLPKVAMLGVGSMGGAILAGLRAPGARVETPIAITTRSEASARAFEGSSDVVACSGERYADANRRAVRGARVVIVAVKPWMVHEVLREIADALEADAIVVSVAAGITTRSMETLLPAGVEVIRAMPNTPSHVGLGLTGLAGGATSSDRGIDAVRRVFETIGRVLVVEESQMNALAAISGSGPAYLFLYVEEMTRAAMRLGFTEGDARLLVEQTVIGSAELLRQSGEDPAALRRKVTSPKGTTEQSVMVLQAAGLGDILDRALAANVRRSEELSGS